MRRKDEHIKLGIVILISSFFYLQPVWSQQSFKFPIIQEGIYKISRDQAQALGINNLEDIGIHGYGGMLPQKLDSMAWQPLEIPVKRMGDALYFFLTDAHALSPRDGEIHFTPHQYTDTLYYVLSSGRKGKNDVREDNLPPFSEPEKYEHGNLFQIQHFKKEENNILSSGRGWYGFRLFNRQGETIPFKVPSGFNSDKIWISATFMAQSTSDSKFKLRIQNSEIGEVNIAAIPNNRYSIKGREGKFRDFSDFTTTNGQLDWGIQYESQDPNGLGYLKEVLVGFQFLSKDMPAGVYYRMENTPIVLETASSMVWEVNDFHQPTDISSMGPFITQSRKLAVFNPVQVPEISQIEPINPSISQVSDFPEMLIITSAELLNQANRLSDFKNKIGVSSQAVLLNDIYNAFGYGNPDITAIRNFIAYHYHQGGNLKNVLFFGKGTFDYKNILGGRPNLVPTYSSYSSLNPLTTYGSDDYFGFLQFGTGEWQETSAGDHLLDIGIGRIPAITSQEAAISVNKIMHYQNQQITGGNWKNQLLFIADDGDNHIHLRDAENHTNYLYQHHPQFNLRKLYLDDFEKTITGSTPSVPEAKKTLEDFLDEGVLLINFIGHGNETTLTAEELFKVSDIRDWPETDNYPIFVTATCEFGRHDSPFIRSGAEELLLAQKKGAIALLTTGRPVFSSVNYSLNKAFIETVFETEGGEGLSLGEVFKITKNNSLNGPLNRNFSLLGDPSLQLNLPELAVETKTLVNLDVNVEKDTLGGFQKLFYKGHITDPLTGSLIHQFNGDFEINLVDKPVLRDTKGNAEAKTTYLDFQTTLFRGNGKVENGKLEGELWLGKNISGDIREGYIKIFAKDNHLPREAMGAKMIKIGGSAQPQAEDKIGPSIEVFFMDSLQSYSKIPSTQSPIWINLKDSSGINMAYKNKEEDITLTINDQPPISLSEKYKSLNGGYREGYVKDLLTGLREGKNTITIRVYDNLGNPSEKIEILEVEGSGHIKILELINFPNPAAAQTQFIVSHNRPGENLNLNLQVFSLLGNEIFSLEKRFPKADSIIEGIDWIFLRHKTNYPVKGTYLYVLQLYSEEDGASVRKGGKIIIQ
ncbi:MAG: type IX secretion system sortase PorU [Cyclobacteriaceae bacterium]